MNDLTRDALVAALYEPDEPACREWVTGTVRIMLDSPAGQALAEVVAAAEAAVAPLPGNADDPWGDLEGWERAIRLRAAIDKLRKAI